MDDSRLMLADAAWRRIAAVLRTAKSLAGAPPDVPDRDFIEAILYRARTGCPWRDLPARFGDWNAVYQRFRRWKVTGVWRALFEQLPGALDVIEALFLDSTVIRAHPHAAGALKEKGGRKPRRSAAAAAALAPRSTSPRRTSGRPSCCT